VLQKCNADPFSEMASTLIDSVKKPPKFDRFQAAECTLNSEGMSSIRIQVYASYQGQNRHAYTYVWAYNQEDSESETFPYDNKEEKTGFTRACAALNGPLSQFFRERGLYVTKKTCYNLEDWVDRKREKL